MGSVIEIFAGRAENELKFAQIALEISLDQKVKMHFGVREDETFYSAAISHAYYAIFYSVKALLLTKKIGTKSPEVHKKTFEAFREEFVETGLLDVELLKIYKTMIVRAAELLEIFKEEKWKRGHYTYETIPQANKGPAEESVQNAKKFLKNIFAVIGK